MKRVEIEIEFKDQSWSKIVEYPTNCPDDYIIKKEQEDWVTFMEWYYPNFEQEWEKHADTYDFFYYPLEVSE